MRAFLVVGGRWFDKMAGAAGAGVFPTFRRTGPGTGRLALKAGRRQVGTERWGRAKASNFRGRGTLYGSGDAAPVEDGAARGA